MKRFNFLFCLCLASFSFGQNIEVIKDSRIDDLIKKQGEPIPPALNVQINGYRLQLFFDSEKSKIDQMRVQFAKSYPKVETYVTYSAPNYFLRVGDFRTQLDADRLKADVNATYPTCFVVQEKVNLPRID